MRIFITGNKGQFGSYLVRAASHKHEVTGGDLPEFDIADKAQVAAVFNDARPELVLHCAAYTNVDAAAQQPNLAYRANGLGTQIIAMACARANIPMLYISSNEVFDGTASVPYREFDNTRPINPYGYSKLAGEWFTQRTLSRFYIVRTSWLTGLGGRNFVHRIQQQADEGSPLRVVTDEVASPTFVPDLAAAILKLIETDHYGIYHFANAGYCSRYEFAKTILALSGRGHIPVEAITLADYSRPSTPPKFSPLANQCGAALGITLPSWQDSLQEFLNASL